jgi:hypothetical protein
MSTAIRHRSLLILGLVVYSSTVMAQDRPGWRPPAGGIAGLKETSVTGTVEGVQGNMINVKNATGHPYIIALLPASKLGVTGTAKPDYLKPGMLVSFTADLDVKKGTISAPLKEMAIITKSETNVPGLFQEDRENKDSTRYFVRGIVKTFKEGNLAVSAGGKQMAGPVASDAVIKLESTDLAVVRQGDEIAVDGRLYQDYRSENNVVRPGQVFGEKVDIKLAEPLSADTFKKKPAAKPKAAG